MFGFMKNCIENKICYFSNFEDVVLDICIFFFNLCNFFFDRNESIVEFV